MRAARCAAVGILILVSVVAGCFDSSDMAVLGDLQALASAISTRYEAPATVNLMTGGDLTVTFQNSKYASLAPAERQAFAREVARFTVAHAASRDSLQVVRVGFRSVKGTAGFTVARSEVPYSWPVAALRSAADIAPPVASADTAPPLASKE